MTLARNLVILIGLVAAWLVAMFFLLMWPAFQAFTVSFGQNLSLGVDQRLASFLWLAVPYASGGLIVGFCTSLLVVSGRPLLWATAAGIVMSVVLLLNAVDLWFLSQPVALQVAEVLLALLPVLFCLVGAFLASKVRRAPVSQHAGL